MTDIKDLKVGDEVTLTIKTTVYSAHPGYVPSVEFQFANGSWMQFDHGDIISGFVTIERAPHPLPTKDGLYIPANNASNPESSWLYSLMTEFREDSEWLVYGSDAGVITGNEALLEVRRAHENLGGLVRLVPEQ